MSEQQLRRVLVEHWLEIAEEDYWSPQTALSADPPKLSVAGFATQQMAEKCLKAYLEHHGAEIPRTHDLRALVAMCSREDQEFATLTVQATALDEVGITPRYPPVRLSREAVSKG
ncbi:MAG: HEPN domain-containing protein, partial [Planctomycetota bacterium]